MIHLCQHNCASKTQGCRLLRHCVLREHGFAALHRYPDSYVNPTLPKLVKPPKAIPRVTHTFYDPDEVITYTTRECLGCERSFESEGPHHRICSNCKRDENWKFGEVET